MTSLAVEQVSATDQPFRDTLAEAGLPIDDLAEDGREFLRFGLNGETVGYVGLELCGSDVLVRSVVVCQHARGLGIGKLIVGSLLRRARSEWHAQHAYLLTTTAAPFFASLGFISMACDKAPAAIQSTREASDLCPSTASFLTISLEDDQP